MSRLYLALDRHLAAEPLSANSLRRLLRDFLDSHADLSDRAMVEIRFDHLLRRKALVSDNTGWKAYPVTLVATLDRAGFELELGVQVAYSSTCPCSAALARQLIQEQFRNDFAASGTVDADAVLRWLGSEQGIVATPHSQRSHADVKVRLASGVSELPIVDLVDRIEGSLKTPVQTAVKREDEQAFARLNGQNLMFCEDAARRMQSALQTDERIADFWLRASHFESLHAHDAVAVAVKGVEGGFGPRG
jgi:GTP cyclohydrolase I